MKLINHIVIALKSTIPRAIIIVISFWIGSDSPIFAQDSWKWVGKEGKINIYTRPSIPFDEIKMTANVNSSPQRLLAIIRDVEGYTDWVYKCTEAKRLKTNSDGNYLYYSKSDFPFPFSDRDIVVHCRQHIDPETKIIHSRSVIANFDHPINKSTVRINELDAHWSFTPLKNGTVDLEYKVKTNPGGNIPSWLVDLGIKEGPMQTMKAFIRKASKNNNI